MNFAPLPRPRFGAASRALVERLEHLATLEERAAALSRFGRDLGDGWYPMYLKVLMVIGSSAPESARRLVADAVAQGLRTGVTTGGTLGAWGVPMMVVPRGGFLHRAGGRALDPMAYLVVWYSQVTSRERLSRELFEDGLTALLTLFSASPPARAIYQARLGVDIQAASEGVFSAETLHRLKLLHDGWIDARAPRQLALAVARAEPPPAAIRDLRVVPQRFV
jgi:hypothetical protein